MIIMNILYELKFNILNFLPCFIPLIMGIALIFNRAIIRPKRALVRSGIFSLLGIAILIFGIIIMSNYLLEYKDYKSRLENNQVQTVEGVVENFHPQPKAGHDSEHFTINGIYFEYSNFNIQNGYCNIMKKNGVIKGNGQKVIIKYIDDDENSLNFNPILYIAETE